MAEDPKSVFYRAQAQQKADAEAKRRANIDYAKAKKQREYEDITRDALNLAWDAPLPPETEQSQWVRENMEWEQSLEFWEPKHCSYSDYSGGFVEKSNVQALLRDHPDIFTESGGGHGWTACGITEEKRLALTVEEWESIKDIIEGLDDYPLIDEELNSELEFEAKMEHWEEYGREGIREALLKKFDGDPDAQIAVVARPNEFWDTMMREHEWDQHMGEEEGCNIYFREEDAVRNIGRDEIVNDDLVEEVKKRVFTEEVANKLSTLLQAEGVDVNNGEHLWQMVKHAEANNWGLWDVEERIHCGKEECDPTDYITFDFDSAVAALTEPEFHQKMLHKHWAEDPRQLKLPGLESRAQQLVTALLDGEDPKSVLRIAKDPKEIARHWVGNMPKEIEIWGRRWFSRTYGNTYFTARIYVDGQLVKTLPEEYGYGDQYLHRAFEWLEENGYIPLRPRNRSNVPDAPWHWAQEHGFKLTYHAEDIRRRRDRFFEANFNFGPARKRVTGSPAYGDKPSLGAAKRYLNYLKAWYNRPQMKQAIGQYADWRKVNAEKIAKANAWLENPEGERPEFPPQFQAQVGEAEDPKSVIRSAGQTHTASKLGQLKVGAKVRIYHRASNIVDYGDTGTVYEFPFGGEPDWANVELDHPRDENMYPFKVSELELI